MCEENKNTRKAKGKVKFFNDQKGYGFIILDDTQEEVFVHHTKIDMGGRRTLQEKQCCEVEFHQEERGPKADYVLPGKIEDSSDSYGGGGGHGYGYGQGRYRRGGNDRYNDHGQGGGYYGGGYGQERGDYEDDGYGGYERHQQRGGYGGYEQNRGGYGGYGGY